MKWSGRFVRSILSGSLIAVSAAAWAAEPSGDERPADAPALDSLRDTLAPISPIAAPPFNVPRPQRRAVENALPPSEALSPIQLPALLLLLGFCVWIGYLIGAKWRKRHRPTLGISPELAAKYERIEISRDAAGNEFIRARLRRRAS